MAWVPQLGERLVGRLLVPLPDVREFGSLQGPFVLKDASDGALPPTLHMELTWIPAGANPNPNPEPAPEPEPYPLSPEPQPRTRTRARARTRARVRTPNPADDWHPSRFHPAGAAWFDLAVPPPGPGAPA